MQPVQVLLPLPLPTYDYLAPADVAVGDIVKVPFGRRTLYGVVWSKNPSTFAKLKSISEKVALPPLPAHMLKFIQWVADYTLYKKGAILKMVMGVPDTFKPDKSTYQLSENPPVIKITETRKKVLDLLQTSPYSKQQIQNKTAVSDAVISGLLKADVIEKNEVYSFLTEEAHNYTSVKLSDEQQQAVDNIKENKVYLLDGVTGSGKTEVYFEFMSKLFAPQHKSETPQQILILLPEIGLSVQWLARFKKRFGFTPYQWHSDISASQKKKIWRSVIKGNIQIIVGTRSALFLPFSNLKAIIIDEEHDGSYKQEEGVIYNARDMAIVRAKLENIPLILVSATPSLETVLNVEKGKYDCLELHNRHADAVLPEIKMVDMTLFKKEKKFISPTLQMALVDNISKGHQSLLFLNRRGYAPLTLCKECGYRFTCPNCSVWLVMHKNKGLHCHHCDYSMKIPDKCPECNNDANFTTCGPGVEYIADEVARLLPQARVAIATSDTVDSPEKADALISQIENNEVDIIVGTQMIAKGYHFPDLTIVGIIDADLGLTGGDLRAIEKTYQVLHQVAGRAGRAKHKGKVYLQSYYPEHPVMKALLSYNKDEILKQELEARRESNMPPFSRLAALIISGENETALREFCVKLVRNAPREEGISVIGPAPAPIYRLRNNFRYRVLIRANHTVQKFMHRWLDGVKPPANIRLKIDVDPYSFL